MKRINLTIILTILLTMSFSIVSLASGVGGALDVIQGSGVDPRIDSRYKDNYELDPTHNNDAAILRGNAKYGDVVVSYTDYVSERNENNENVIRKYRLKSYVRIWYDDDFDEFGKPCIVFSDNKSINGSEAIYDVLTFKMGNAQTKSPNVSLTNYYEDKNGLFNLYQIKNATQSCELFYYYGTKRDVEIISSDFPVFSNDDDAAFFLNTGTIRDAIINPNENKNIPADITAGQIYLEDFQAIYHDAPSLDDCYIEFKYSIPKHLRNLRRSLYLDITDLYRFNLKMLSVLDIKSYEYLGKDRINVSENPYGFTIPICDFISVRQLFDKEGEWSAKRLVLGNEFLGFDYDDWVICGQIANSVEKITKSELYLDIQLYLGTITLGTNGSKYNVKVDFLDLKNCTYNNEPYDDTLKKYVPSDSPIKDGYYSTDGKGNYNYHSSRGDVQTITSYDYDNSTNSTQYITNNYYGGGGGGSGGGNGTLTDLAINVGDIIFNIDIGSIGGNDNSGSLKDYLLPDSTLGALKTGFGFLDNPETEQKGDGFISFLGSFYSFLPDDFTKIIMFGIAVIVVLGILSIVIKVVF